MSNNSLFFNGRTLALLDNQGQTIRQWNATSGRPGSTPADQHRPYIGPIPEGNYSVEPRNIDHYDWWNPADWDWRGPTARDAWGNWRVPIDKLSDNQTSRGGFFIHGGKNPGSAGCIDLTNQEDGFFRLLQGYTMPLPLKVQY